MLSYIISNAADNDDELFLTGIYREYKKLVYSRAAEYCGNVTDVEDVAQSTWVKLTCYAKTLRGLEKGAMIMYIMFTTRSCAVERIRRSRREQRMLELHGALFEDMHISAEEEYFHYASAEQLREVWPELSEDTKLLLEGKYYFGLPDAHLAEILGCKPGSVRMKLTRARREARRLMAEKGYTYE